MSSKPFKLPIYHVEPKRMRKGIRYKTLYVVRAASKDSALHQVTVRIMKANKFEFSPFIGRGEYAYIRSKLVVS